MVEEYFNRDDVIRTLATTSVTKVTFFKVSGELRDMQCTLNPETLGRLKNNPLFAESLKSYDPAIEASQADDDAEQVRVFDLEKKGWRSFLISNLVSIEGEVHF